MFTTKKLTFSPAKAGEFRLRAENENARDSFARKLAATPAATKPTPKGRGIRAHKARMANSTPAKAWTPDQHVRVGTPLIPRQGISFTDRRGKPVVGAAAEAVARRVLNTLR